MLFFSKRAPQWLGLLLIGGTVGACTGLIGDEGATVVGDDPPIDLSKPLPGESTSGEAGILFPRLSTEQWRNSALQLLGLPESTPLVLPTETRIDRFQFETDVSVSVIAETSLTQFRDAAEGLANLATKDDAAVNALLPNGSPADLAGRAAAFSEAFLTRAFRRPATTEEVAASVKYFTDASGASDAEKLRAGMRLAIQTALQSPHFLCRVELGATDKVNASPVGGRVPLTPYELAARLSLVLFNAAPDAAMLADVKAGKYDSTDAYLKQLDVLLQDPRLSPVLLRFHEQLFAIERFGQISKDAQTFPSFSPALGQDMRQDMTRTVADVMDSGGGISELLTTRTGFVNARLAPVYGLSAAGYTDNLQKVELPAERAGVLSRAGWQAFTAGPLQRRDIIRGYYVSQNLLCEEVQSAKDPPKTPSAYPDNLKTNRQRMEFTTGETVCKTCHNAINPKGFAFEHFDALGVFQTQDGGEAVDAKASISLDGKSVSFDGSAQMMALMAESHQVQACYAKKWTQYLLGYKRSTLEENISEEVAEAAAKKHMSTRDVLRVVLRSPAFTTRKLVEVAK